MSAPICSVPNCERTATVAMQTQRPTRVNLWTKVWWEQSAAPAKAQRYCGEHTAETLAELAKVLA